MNHSQQSDTIADSTNAEATIVGATILATTSLLVGGCDEANQVFMAIDDSIVADWYIGNGEHAEAGDVICKLIGSLSALQSGEEVAICCLHEASQATSNDLLFQMRYKID